MPSLDWVKVQMRRDATFAKKGNDFQKYCYEDAAPGAFPSRNQRNKAAKAASRQMLQRDEAVRLCTMHALGPSAIRFSIRPRSQAGPIYCIDMVGSPQRQMAKRYKHVVDLTTPWHNVAVRATGTGAEDGVFLLRRRFVACLGGAAPVHDDHGWVCGYTLPIHPSLPVDAESKDTFTANGNDKAIKTTELELMLPAAPTDKEICNLRNQVVANAAYYGWSGAVTKALRENGDCIASGYAYGAKMPSHSAATEGTPGVGPIQVASRG